MITRFSRLSSIELRCRGRERERRHAESARAQAHAPGSTKDEVLDTVFGLRVAGLSRKLIDASYDKALEHDEWYGDPKSAWGLAGGITEIARDLPNASERVVLDRAAGKVMAMAF